MTRRQTCFCFLLVALTIGGAGGLLYLDNQWFGKVTTAQEPSTVLVRFIHAYPANTALDIYVESALVADGLAFGESTPHLRLASAEVTVDVRVAGSSPQSTPLARELVSLTTSSSGYGQISLVVQSDNFNLPAIAKIEDLLSPTAFGSGRLHLIHTVPVLGTIDLAVAETNAPFLANVAFNETVGTVDPAVGTYNLVITPAGGMGFAFAGLESVHVNSGYLTTVLVLPSLSGSGVEARVIQAPVLPNLSIETSLVQLGNGSPDAPPFDLYADDTLIIAGLAPGDLLPHTSFPSQEITFSVREAGSPSSISPAYEQTVDFSDPDQIYSVITLGTFEDGTFTFGVFADELGVPDPESTYLRVINATSNGPLTLDLDSGTGSAVTIANTLAPMTSADVQAVDLGIYRIDGVVDDAEINGPLTVQLDPQSFVGGSYITLLAFTAGDPALSMATTTLNADILSLPGAVDAVALVPTPTPTATITNTPLPPTLTPTAAVIIPNASGSTIVTETYIVATVVLNSGINLQCREYPSPQATSLGLIPNGSILLVLGYAGPADPTVGEQFTPVEAGAFAQPEGATSFEQIWLQIDWASPEGLVRCWVRSDFTRLTFVEESSSQAILEPAALFGLATREEPVTGRIPSNFNGGVFGTTATAPIIPNVTPSPAPPAATATPDLSLIIGQISGTSNVILRAEPNVNGVPVTTLPLGANVIVLGRNADDTWLKVRYEVVGEAASEGWLLTELITFTSIAINVNDLNVVQ